MRRRRGSGAVQAPRDEGTLLAFQDLEVPVQALPTVDDERRSGKAIRACLRRLSFMLPLHPAGYRRFLARMEQMVTTGAPMFTWFPMAGRMGGDLALARHALRRAEVAAATSPARAWRHYEGGVAILRRYLVDPETLDLWSREVVGTLRRSRPLDRLPRSIQADRIVRRLTQILEEERNRLVLPNFRLVLKEVFRYRPVGMMRSDLFQEGIIGLHKAIFRFDPDRGTRFSTYATFWIRQSMRKSLTDRSRLIRVPQAVQERLHKDGDGLGPAERDRVRRLMRGAILFSYGEQKDPDDGCAFEVEDPSVPELGEALRLRKTPQVVQEALDALSTRQREVLQRRFGLDGERPQTLEEIGVQLNLSRERIRQIEQAAIDSMRRRPSLWEAYEDLGEAQVTAASTHG